MYPFEFEEDDVLWDILKKYSPTSTEMRQAVLSWLYVVARDNERGDTWEKLNDAYRSYRREMRGVDKNKMKEIYNL